MGFTSDDAVYLLLADLYSFRNTGEVLLYDLIRQESYFPPLYPLILGLLGGDSSNPALAGNITITFLLISIFISGIWLWKETANKPISIIITLSVFLLPGTLIFAQEIWSEFLFMVFLYGTFLLGSKKKLEGQDWLGMAVLIALSSLTRSIGISLVIAFCLLLINKRVKFATTYALISMTPFLFWNLARENYLNRPDYVDTFTSTIMNLSPHDISVLLITKIVTMLDAFQWLFTSIETNTMHHYFSVSVLLVFLFFILCGFFTRIKLFKLDAVFIILYLAIIFIWPYSEVYYVSRFLYPLVPLLFLYLYLGIHKFYNNKKYLYFVFVTLFTSLLVISFPSSKQFIQRAYINIESSLNPYRRNRQWLMATTENEGILLLQTSKFILNTLEIIPNSIPEEECIYATQAPLVMLHTKRIAGIFPSPEISEEQFIQQTRQCKYILSMPTHDAKGQHPDYYPMQRLDPDQYNITAYNSDLDNNKGVTIFLFERILDTNKPE